MCTFRGTWNNWGAWSMFFFAWLLAITTVQLDKRVLKQSSSSWALEICDIQETQQLLHTNQWKEPDHILHLVQKLTAITCPDLHLERTVSAKDCHTSSQYGLLLLYLLLACQVTHCGNAETPRPCQCKVKHPEAGPEGKGTAHPWEVATNPHQHPLPNHNTHSGLLGTNWPFALLFLFSLIQSKVHATEHMGLAACHQFLIEPSAKAEPHKRGYHARLEQLWCDAHPTMPSRGESLASNLRRISAQLDTDNEPDNAVTAASETTTPNMPQSDDNLQERIDATHSILVAAKCLSGRKVKKTPEIIEWVEIKVWENIPNKTLLELNCLYYVGAEWPLTLCRNNRKMKTGKKTLRRKMSRKSCKSSSLNTRRKK